MIKLLIDKHGDKPQHIVEVFQSGSYSDKSKVLWDERVDGPFPDAMLGNVGGIVRDGKDLVLDLTKLSEHQAAKGENEAKKQDRKAKLATAIQELDALDLSGPMTANEVQKAVKHLVRVVRNMS